MRESTSAALQLWKMISIFCKDYPEKLIATFLPLDSALTMGTSTVKPTTKQKRGRPAQVTKQTKKAQLWIFQPHER